MYNKVASLKIESFLRKLRHKKTASIGFFQDVITDEDAKTSARMVHEMLQLPKYDPIRNSLRASSGVVNFVTNGEYSPLVELLLKSAFPPSNNDIYHMGNEVSLPEDYFVDARSYFGATQRREANQEAIGSMEELLMGTHKKMTRQWLKQNNITDDILTEMYQDPAAVQQFKESMEEYEANLKAIRDSALRKEVIGLYRKLREDADRRAFNAANHGDKTKEQATLDIEEVIRTKEELRNKRAFLKRKIDLLNNGFEELNIVDSHSKQVLRNNDGFVNWNPLSEIRAANAALLESPHKSGAEVERSIRVIIQKMDEYKTTNPALNAIRKQIINFFATEDPVVKWLHNIATYARIMTEFLKLAGQNGKVMILTNVENSSLVTPPSSQEQNGYYWQGGGVLEGFQSANTANYTRDHSEGRDSRGKRTIILVSNNQIANLPYANVIEMKVSPVDPKEAEIIVRHMLLSYSSEATKAAEIKLLVDIEKKYEGQQHTPQKEIEMSEISKILAARKDTLGRITPEAQKGIEEMIVGLGQRVAITRVKDTLAANANYKRDEDGNLIEITLDETAIVDTLTEKVNQESTANALGLSIRKPKVAFSRYEYKRGSEWGTLVGDHWLRKNDMSRIENEIMFARREISNIDVKLLTPKLSSTTKQAYMKDREGWVNELNSLYYSKNQVMKDLPHYVILWGKPGVGKCFGKGTSILMFNGKTKMVEDIVKGDLLMGPDSNPRTVLNTTKGIGPLYKVSQKLGDDYICNNAHILSLQNTDKSTDQDPIFISAEDFCSKNKTWKHRNKGWKTGVEFPEQNIPIDPYWMGLWLGDGVSRVPAIVVGDKDKEIAIWLEQWAIDNKLFIRKEKQQGCSTWHFTDMQGSNSGCTFNHIKTHLRELNVLMNKHVPEIYWKNSSKNRLLLLAGLIDSDGYRCKSGTIQFTNVNENLARDVFYLARSLGFRVTWSENIKTIKSIDYKVLAYTVTIGGTLSRIPIKLPRKMGHDNPQKKSLRYAISVDPIGEGDYYGFMVDGDHQFLLGDFTVTHNSVWADAIGDLIKIPIRWVRIGSIKDKWVGNTEKYSEQLINAIFGTVNSVYLIDELDRMLEMQEGSGGVGRGRQSHETTESIVADFLNAFEERLQELIEHNVYVIITTNNLARIDTAMMERTRGDVYHVEAANSPEACLRYLWNFLETERGRNPKDPWIKNGKNDKESWENTFNALRSLDLDKISKVMATRELSFRNISGLFRQMCRCHNSFLISSTAFANGEVNELQGMPLTTDNAIRAARISVDSSNGNENFDFGVGKIRVQTEVATKEALAKDKPKIQEVIDPITKKKSKQIVIPDSVMSIMNGEVEINEEETELPGVVETEVEDPNDPTRKRKRVEIPTGKTMQQLTDSGMVEQPIVEQETDKKPNAGITQEKAGKEKGVAEELRKDNIKSSTDYYLDFLEKKGLVENNKLVSQVQPNPIGPIGQAVPENTETGFDKLERNGVYYFNKQQIMIAPCDIGLEPQRPKGL